MRARLRACKHRLRMTGVLRALGGHELNPAARRLLGGLRGHREGVSRRAPATYGVAAAAELVLASVLHAASYELQLLQKSAS